VRELDPYEARALRLAIAARIDHLHRSKRGGIRKDDYQIDAATRRDIDREIFDLERARSKLGIAPS
jgi:hypothetical protein